MIQNLNKILVKTLMLGLLYGSCQSQKLGMKSQEANVNALANELANVRIDDATAAHEHNLRVERWIDDYIKIQGAYLEKSGVWDLNLPAFFNREDIKKLVADLCRDWPISSVYLKWADLDKLIAAFSALEGTSVGTLQVGEDWDMTVDYRTISDSWIISDDDLRKVSEAFSSLKKTKITKLLLGGNNLGEGDEKIFCKILSALKGTSVRTLYLGCNNLSSLPYEAVYDAFSSLKGTEVEELNIEYNELGDSVFRLFSALKGTPVRKLGLCSNKLGELGPQAIHEAFSYLKNTKIEELNIEHNYMNDRDHGSALSFYNKVFPALEGTPVRILHLSEYLSNSSTPNHLTAATLRETLFKLKNTQVCTVQLGDVTHEHCPNWLVNEFNTQIAYPHHDAIYGIKATDLKAACIRAIREAMPDLDPDRVKKLPIPTRFQEAIKAKEPGLYAKRVFCESMPKYEYMVELEEEE